MVRRALPYHRLAAVRTTLIETPQPRRMGFPRTAAQADAVSARAPEFPMTKHTLPPRRACRFLIDSLPPTPFRGGGRALGRDLGDQPLHRTSPCDIPTSILPNRTRRAQDDLLESPL